MKSRFYLLVYVSMGIVWTLNAQSSSYMVAPNEAPLSHRLEAPKPTDAWKEIEDASSRFDYQYGETAGSLDPAAAETKYVESWFVATADKAQEFYKKFPRNTNAPAAKQKELEMLCRAFNETYATNLFPRIYARATKLVKDTSIDKSARFKICNFILNAALIKKHLLPADVDFLAELEEEARIWETDFRDLGPASLLTWLAHDLKAEKTRPMFRELAENYRKVVNDPIASGYYFGSLVSESARLREMIGQPLVLQFTNFNGQAVDTQEMNEKVIAVDFWGTSYPQCLTNVLRLKQFYQKFHARGLEIIGVNVDRDSEAVKKFVSEHKIEWPQYWDGKEMQNKLVQVNHVTRAGTILLVNKKGLLCDVNGDEDLDEKVKKLLAE